MNIKDITPETSVLELMRIGVCLFFNGSVYMDGDPDTGYIDVGVRNNGSDGLWSLDRPGLENALCDVKAMIKSEEELSQLNDYGEDDNEPQTETKMDDSTHYSKRY